MIIITLPSGRIIHSILSTLFSFLHSLSRATVHAIFAVEIVMV